MSDPRDDKSAPAAEPAEPAASRPDDAGAGTDAGIKAGIDAGQHREPAEPALAAPSARPRGRAALLAALLAAVAMVIAGAAWWQSQTLEQRLSQTSNAALEAHAAASARRVDALEEAVAELRGRSESQGGALARLAESTDQAVARLREDMAQWPVRLGDIEASIGALRGVSDDARRRWLQAEAEYFLNIANSELQLVGDVDRAIQALELADARLRQLDEPRLATVRAAIAAELGALRAVPRIDRAGISLRLATLAQRVDSLPLPQPAPAHFDAGGPARPADLEPGLERAWATLREALAKMVSVRRDDSPVVPQLAPQEIFALRRNLELQIENARLALLQRETALFREHLHSAMGWLEGWFDASDPAVAGFQEALAEMAALDVAPALPEIDESLRRLRDQTRDRSGTP